MVNRLFTFGCSFTKYYWPTWANIIAHDLKLTDLQFFNYGGVGLGNVAIQTLILEADLAHNFTENDLLIVCWSGWSRDDRYLHRGWNQGYGNILKDNNDKYDKTYVEKFWTLENDIIKNCSAYIYVNKLYNVYNMSITPFSKYEFSGYAHSLDITSAETVWNFYKEFIDTRMPYYYDTFYKKAFNELIEDTHPDILHHLHQVKDKLYPIMGLQMSHDTITYFTEMQAQIISDILNNKDRPKFFRQNKILNLEDFFKKYENMFLSGFVKKRL